MDRVTEVSDRIYKLLTKQLKVGEDFEFLGSKRNGDIEAQNFRLFYGEAMSLSDDEINQIKTELSSDKFEVLISNDLADFKVTNIDKDGITISLFVKSEKA